MDLGNVVSLVVSAVLVANIILAGLVVFIERRDVGTTWAWLMVLLFVPTVGFVVYLFFGRRFRPSSYLNLSREEKMYLDTAVDRQILQLKQTRYFGEPLLEKHSDLLLMNLKANNALLTLDNEIRIFYDGREKFEALFADIRAAKREINLQYYIIRGDALGKRLRDELLRKAQEGVKIRILYDEVGSKRLPRSFFRSLEECGAEVAVFFPSHLRLVNFRINNRNHRKLCVIDGEIAYLGGFNVGDEYLGLSKKFGNWRDTHLRIQGGAVRQILGRFLLDWGEATRHRPGLEPPVNQAGETGQERFGSRGGTSAVQVIASGPHSQTEHIKNMYIKLIATAKTSVFVQTPYFIPDASFMDACKIALLAGVDLRIMIPDKPDHPFVYWATWAYAGELLSFGARILLYKKGFLHAKTIVADREVASVGTANIDMRSFKLNFEVNALIYDQNIAGELYDAFLRDSRDCVELTPELYGGRSLQIRFKEAVSRLLSPIL